MLVEQAGMSEGATARPRLSRRARSAAAAAAASPVVSPPRQRRRTTERGFPHVEEEARAVASLASIFSDDEEDCFGLKRQYGKDCDGGADDGGDGDADDDGDGDADDGGDGDADDGDGDVSSCHNRGGQRRARNGSAGARSLSYHETYSILYVFNKASQDERLLARFFNKRAKKTKMNWANIVLYMKNCDELRDKIEWLTSSVSQSVKLKNKSRKLQ